MTKRLLILSLAVSMMLSVPVLVKAAEVEMLQTEQTYFGRRYHHIG